MKHTVKKFNKVHNKYKDKFKKGVFGLHNLLWQIMINDSMKDSDVTFTAIVVEQGCEIVIASLNGGYHETGVIFESEDYSQCNDVCEELGLSVFGLKFDDHLRLVSRSMGLPV